MAHSFAILCAFRSWSCGDQSYSPQQQTWVLRLAGNPFLDPAAADNFVSGAQDSRGPTSNQQLARFSRRHHPRGLQTKGTEYIFYLREVRAGPKGAGARKNSFLLEACRPKPRALRSRRSRLLPVRRDYCWPLPLKRPCLRPNDGVGGQTGAPAPYLPPKYYALATFPVIRRLPPISFAIITALTCC